MDIRINVRNTELLKEWEEKIGEEVSKLESRYPDIIHHLRVTITAPGHHRLGAFEIHAVSTVPDDTIVVKNNGELVIPLIGDVFSDLNRQLREYNRKRQHLMRQELPYGIGNIRRVFPEGEYGFIQSAGGREIYFHRNALKNCAYNDLREDDSVEFSAEEGEKGAQATWVKLKHRRGK
jgi:cold shock CspA family protein/ribosome-associated translation inhibitor RaiA